MLEISFNDGSTSKIVNRSRNLRGVRRYLKDNPAKRIFIYDKGFFTNKESNISKPSLTIIFENGAHFGCEFESFRVLKQTIRNWRNLYGVPISINGIYSGLNVKSNNSLQ